MTVSNGTARIWRCAINKYDGTEGLMGGVNTNRHYARTMGFGYFNDAKGQIEITHPLLQGGIVCF